MGSSCDLCDAWDVVVGMFRGDIHGWYIDGIVTYVLIDWNIDGKVIFVLICAWPYGRSGGSNHTERYPAVLAIYVYSTI
jgi:hypothetical protein